MRAIYTLATPFIIHHLEIVGTTSDDVGQLEVLQDIGRHLHQVVAMRSTVVHIVVEDGSLLVSILQECQHLGTNHGIDGIERAKHHHIIRLDIRCDKLQTIMGMVLVEDILRIVVVIEERQ